MDSRLTAKLSKTYYSPRGYWKGLTAIKRLAAATKVSEDVAKDWLKKQAIWQIYLPAPRRIPRPRFDVSTPNKVHQADLLFLPHDRRHRPCRRRIDYNSWRSQLFYETCSGFVPAPLNEGVFCLLIESDCSMGFLCSSPNLSLHLGIFLGLIDDKAEFFIRDLTICECPRDMVCDGVQFALREHSDLVMLFGLHWEPAADEFTGDTKEPTAQGCNFEP